MSNLEILAYEQSPLGLLCLRRRELLSEPGTVVTEITLDHEFLMSSYNTDSERALSDTAAELHKGANLRVLVGGLGLGYTAHQILACERVADVQVVEFLPQVIQWLRDGLLPLSPQLGSEPRFSVVQGDVYARLAQAPDQKYDLILIDVDHSPEDRLDGDANAPNKRFYTQAGLTDAKQHLAKGGILGIWSYAESSPFADALRNCFEQVHIQPVTFENTLIDEETTDWLFFAWD